MVLMTVALIGALSVPALAFAAPGSTGAKTAISSPVSTQAAPALTSTAAPANTTDAGLANGVYVISSALRSSAVLDVCGGSASKGAKLQLWDSNTTPAQRWYIEKLGNSGYYKISNVGSGKVLDVSGGSKKAGTRIQQYTWNNTPAQKWKITKTSGGLTITSALSYKLVLDVSGANKNNGAAVQTYTANGSKAQVWKFTAVKQTLPNGVYTFVNAGSNKVIDIAGGSVGKGANVQQYESNNTKAQMFQASFNAKTGYYTIKNVQSDYVLDVARGSTKNGANVRQWPSNNTKAQMWDIKANTDGSYTLRCANSGKALDVVGASSANGANVQMYTSNGTLAQKWVAKVVDVKKAGVVAGGTSYEKLALTLDQLVTLNWDGNSYNRQYLDSKSELKYYMNPANGSKYQFADLRVQSATTAVQLNSFISSSSSGVHGKLKDTGKYFVKAAQTYKLNQDYLLAHAILESGWGTSTLAMGYYYTGGTIDGKKYPAGTYYNFYGIGAYDSSPLSGGRKMAIINGWSSPEKAIMGAAQWIAKNYVYKADYPQCTLYAMKWDYGRSNASLAYGWHQYATSATWAHSIARIIGDIYARTGTDKKLTYIRPRYK